MKKLKLGRFELPFGRGSKGKGDYIDDESTEMTDAGEERYAEPDDTQSDDRYVESDDDRRYEDRDEDDRRYYDRDDADEDRRYYDRDDDDDRRYEDRDDGDEDRPYYDRDDDDDDRSHYDRDDDDDRRHYDRDDDDDRRYYDRDDDDDDRRYYDRDDDDDDRRYYDRDDDDDRRYYDRDDDDDDRRYYDRDDDDDDRRYYDRDDDDDDRRYYDRDDDDDDRRYYDRGDDDDDRRYGSRFDDGSYAHYSGRFGGPDDEEDRDSDRRSHRGRRAPEETDAEAVEADPQEAKGSRVLDYVLEHDWVMYASVILLPPLGIYLLYRKQPLKQPHNRIAMGASAVWFIILLVLFFRMLAGGGSEDPVQTALPTPTVNEVVAMETPAPTVQTVVLTTEAPVAAEPTATPVPENVFVSTNGTYYHSEKSCELLGSGEELYEVSLDNAVNRGKYECPVCFGLEQYYATAKGTYYHLDKSCSGMSKASVWSQEAAEAAGKLACPICVGTVQSADTAAVETEPDATREPQPSVQFISSSTKDQSGITVYRTKGGKYYHTVKDCSGMKNATQASLKDALLEGKIACPTCCDDSGIAIYCTEKGKSFHKTASCSGMKNATKASVAEALVMGKKECDVCKPLTGKTEEQLAQEAAESVFTVYAEDGGKYYHTNATCSGMTSAKMVTLSSMLKEGRAACPECCKGADTAVYISETTGTYHSVDNCSGMTDGVKTTRAEAMANGYKRCPKCWETTTNA